MTKILFTQSDIVELVVEKGNPMGGAVVESLIWMTALNQLGIKVQLVKNANDKRPILEEFAWIETVTTFDPKKGIKWLRWVTYRFPTIFMALKNSKADYIYEPIPTWNSFFLGIFCKLLGIKQILRVANDNMLDGRIKITHSRFDQIFIHLGFKICNFISVQNEFQFNALKRKLPFKKIIKLFNPFIIQDNLELKVFDEKSYICWVANFRYQKNLRLLFNIASTITNNEFKIAGQSKEKMDEETHDFVEKLKFLANIEFVGSVSRKDILNFFSKSKFLLNTSHYEGFSNTFLESMMTGTPILTTANVNPDGIIDTFGLGYIYKDENDLKQILNNISETDYLEKSKNCTDYIKNNHDHLVLGKRFMDFLKG